MWPRFIIETTIPTNRCSGLPDAAVGAQINLQVHRRSTTTLSRQAPLPSMLMSIFSRNSTPVKAMLVN